MHEKISTKGALALALFAAACSSPSNEPGDGGGNSGAGSNACEARGNDSTGNLLVKANAANDYAFSSTLSIDVTPVASRTELSFDWSAVNKDFIGHPVQNPGDIDMVTLLLWSLSQSQLEEKLNDDALAQSDLVAIAMLYTNKTKTSGGLFDFTSFGQAIEQNALLTYLDATQYDPATHSYTVMAVSGTTAGKGTRMMRGIKPDPSVTNTKVTIDAQSTKLKYTADLQSLRPTRIPAATARVAIDWTDMKVNAMGNEFLPAQIDEVRVGRYDESVTDLEARFLDLDLLAEDMFKATFTSGTSLPLSSLMNSAGQTFTGIDDESTWVVALVCGRCANPAPWYLAVLKTCK
jgi:hypothetical protein